MGEPHAPGILTGNFMSPEKSDGTLSISKDDRAIVDQALKLAINGNVTEARHLLLQFLGVLDAEMQHGISVVAPTPMLSFKAPIAELWVNRDHQRFKITTSLCPDEESPYWLKDFHRVVGDLNQSFQEGHHLLDEEGNSRAIDEIALDAALRAIGELVASETNGLVSSERILHIENNDENYLKN